jgi:hypothetical protein
LDRCASAVRPPTIGAMRATVTDDFGATIIETERTLVAVHLRPRADRRHGQIESRQSLVFAASSPTQRCAVARGLPMLPVFAAAAITQDPQ